MATLNPTNAIATQAVHYAAAQLAALDWIDQEAAQQLSPMAEAVANMFMVAVLPGRDGPGHAGRLPPGSGRGAAIPARRVVLTAGKKNKKNILLTDRLTHWEGQGRLLGRPCLFRSYIVKGGSARRYARASPCRMMKAALGCSLGVRSRIVISGDEIHLQHRQA